jgi:hypothetical protein
MFHVKHQAANGLDSDMACRAMDFTTIHQNNDLQEEMLFQVFDQRSLDGSHDHHLAPISSPVLRSLISI